MTWAFIRMFAMLAFATVVLIAESAAMHLAEKSGVAMSLLAGGGALPLLKLVVAGVAMAVRLFARIMMPGLVAQSLIVGAMDVRRAWKRPAKVAVDAQRGDR